VRLPPDNSGARLPSPFFISWTERISLPCSLGLGPATPPYAQPRPARFDTFRHPHPNQLNALRNEMPPNPANPFDTFRHATPNRINALRNESPGNPPRPFDTFRHSTPNRTNAVRNESPGNPPRPFDTFRHPRVPQNQRRAKRIPRYPPSPVRHFSTPHAQQNQRLAKRITCRQSGACRSHGLRDSVPRPGVTIVCAR
jgi:hypothetical protein